MPFIYKIRVIIFDHNEESEPPALNLQASIFLRFVFHLFIFCVPGTFDLNTYTVTAISGIDFYSSIKKAYIVARRNPAKYMVTIVVSFFQLMCTVKKGPIKIAIFG